MSNNISSGPFISSATCFLALSLGGIWYVDTSIISFTLAQTSGWIAVLMHFTFWVSLLRGSCHSVHRSEIWQVEKEEFDFSSSVTPAESNSPPRGYKHTHALHDRDTHNLHLCLKMFTESSLIVFQFILQKNELWMNSKSGERWFYKGFSFTLFCLTSFTKRNSSPPLGLFWRIQGAAQNKSFCRHIWIIFRH